MNNHLKTIFKVAVFFGVGITILYLLFQNQQAAFAEDCVIKGVASEDCSLMDKLIADFSGANFWWIGVVVICFMISNLSRALRWNMMLKPLGVDAKLYNTIGSIMIAYFTNLGIPRSGEIIRSVMISRYEDIKVEEAMGTIIVDRILDVICLLIVIGLAFVMSFNHMSEYFSENIDIGAKLGILSSPIVLGSMAMFGILILFIIYKNWTKILETSFGKKIYEIAIGFIDGLKSVKDVENIPLFLFHTFVIWFMYFLMTYLCFLAFAPTAHLGLVAGLVVFVFGSIGMVIPSPGGMGSYHFLAGEALALYGINGADAFSYANIVFISIQLFCNIFFGILFLILLPILNRMATPIST